jgi:hypothetical protein
MSAEDDGGGAGRDSDIENAENGQTQPGSVQGGKPKPSKEGGSKPGAGGDADTKAETKTWEDALFPIQKNCSFFLCCFLLVDVNAKEWSMPELNRGDSVLANREKGEQMDLMKLVVTHNKRQAMQAQEATAIFVGPQVKH